MKLSEAHVTIVGLGLIGGSMAAGLHGRCAAVVGVDVDPETLRLARERGIVDRAESDLAAGLETCDMAILAVPVGEILSILTRMGGDLPAPKSVLDVGSTKADIVSAMGGLPTGIAAVGGHPLCGKEVSGLSAAEADLFRGKTFVVTPSERSSDDVRRLTGEIIDALGARPVVMQAIDHDRLLAVTSHLPYLMAVTMVACVAEVAASDPRVWDVTASGFRDSTRLAGSDIRMMMDILSTNAANIQATIHAARDLLAKFESFLQKGDLAAVEVELRRARTHRMQVEGRTAARIEGSA